jgi:hypothetical protein
MFDDRTPTQAMGETRRNGTSCKPDATTSVSGMAMCRPADFLCYVHLYALTTIHQVHVPSQSHDPPCALSAGTDCVSTTVLQIHSMHSKAAEHAQSVITLRIVSCCHWTHSSWGRRGAWIASWTECLICSQSRTSSFILNLKVMPLSTIQKSASHFPHDSDASTLIHHYKRRAVCSRSTVERC